MGPGTSAYILPDGSGTGCTRGKGGGGRESVQLLTGEPVSPLSYFVLVSGLAIFTVCRCWITCLDMTAKNHKPAKAGVTCPESEKSL